MALTSHIEEYLENEARKRRIPLHVKLELLPICNLNCKMCYIRTDMADVRKMGGLISHEKWIQLAKEMREAGTLFLLLTGGEVFMYPEFRSLYEELYQMGFYITINTNATLIDEKTVEWLSQMPPKLMSISLYGASDDTYYSLCGQTGMFSKVDYAIKLLQKKKIHLELKTLLNPLNVHDAQKMSDYAKERKIFYLSDSYAYPPSRRNTPDEVFRFTPREAAEQKIAFSYRQNSAQDFAAGIIKHLARFERTKCIPGEELWGFTCAASNYSCWVNWKGKMTPCVMMEEPSERPFDKGFLAAWQELKNKCDRIQMASKCSFCDKRGVCTVCPAANLAETGSFDNASPFHCEMTSHTLEEMNRMVKEWGIDIGALVNRKG